MNAPLVIERRRGERWRWPLWFAAAAAVTVFTCLPLYNIPSGQKVNGAGWFGGIVMLSFVSLVPGIVVLPAALRDRAFSWRWVTMLLAVGPMPLSIVLARHAQWLKGFTFQ
jgi:hypothetical protein